MFPDKLLYAPGMICYSTYHSRHRQQDMAKCQPITSTPAVRAFVVRSHGSLFVAVGASCSLIMSAIEVSVCRGDAPFPSSSYHIHGPSRRYQQSTCLFVVSSNVPITQVHSSLVVLCKSSTCTGRGIYMYTKVINYRRVFSCAGHT